MSEPSIFTRIIRGEIPAHKVYEDERTLAFLDIHPTQPGHTLIVPKKEVGQLWDLDDEDYQAVMATAKKVALRLREVLGRKRIGEQVMGLDVNHAHVHLIPFDTIDEYYYRPDMTAEPDHTALAGMAQKIKF
jgi:histidine triad (HIT) family protein